MILSLFYVFFRCKSSEWLESSIESDLGILNGALTQPFTILLASNTTSRRVSLYLHIFMIQENKIFIFLICDPLFFSFVNRDTTGQWALGTRMASSVVARILT